VDGKLPAPEKGVRPNMTGVACRLVRPEDLPEDVVKGLEFGRGQRKASPYDALLRQLADSKGQWAQFDDARAKASVGARSKKLGYRVSFAEAKGKLYVRFDGLLADDLRGTRREKALELLKTGPKTKQEIAFKIRESGDATCDAIIAELILDQCVKDGLVVARDGGRYGLSPRGATGRPA
jgi:hypothetical protein